MEIIYKERTGRLRCNKQVLPLPSLVNKVLDNQDFIVLGVLNGADITKFELSRAIAAKLYKHDLSELKQLVLKMFKETA